MSVSKAPIPSPAGSAWDESAAWYRMPPNADDRRSMTRLIAMFAVVTCVAPSVKALLAWGSGPQALVKVERPQRSEDERP